MTLVQMPGDVPDRSTAQAAGMVVWIGSPVVAGGSVAVGQLDGQPAPNEGFEALVHGCEGDAGEISAHGQEDFVGRGVSLGRSQKAEHCGALLRVPLAALFQGGAEDPLRTFGTRAYLQRDPLSHIPDGRG